MTNTDFQLVSPGNVIFQTNTFIVNSQITAISANGSYGGPGQVLISNGTTNYWGSANTAAEAPGGANQAVQFNRSTVFAGNVGLTFNEITNNLSLGNTLNIGTGTLNSTAFSGTANNTNFVGITSAANVVSNAQLIANLAGYQTLSGLPSNVATLTANNTNFVGTTSAANVVSNAQLIANLSNYVLGTSLTTDLAGYQTLSGLPSNVATLTSNNSTNFAGQPQSYYANASFPILSGGINIVSTTSPIIYLNAGNDSYQASIQFQSNSIVKWQLGQQLGNTNFFLWNNSLSSNPITVWTVNDQVLISNSLGVGANLNINTSAILIGNSTVNATINSTIFSGTSNNSLNLGGSAASLYQLNSTLAANVATLTANNTNFVGTTSAANVVSNAQLIANLAGIANGTFLTANNANNFGGQPPSYYANVTSPSFSANISVGANVFITTGNINVTNTIASVVINPNQIIISSGDNSNYPLKIYSSNNTALAGLIGDQVNTSGFNIYNYNTNASAGCFLNIHFSRGTNAAPLPVISGDRIGSLTFYSNPGTTGNTTFEVGAAIRAFTDIGTISNTSNPTYLSFFTTSNGAITVTEALRIDANQNIIIPSGNLSVNTSTGYLNIGNSTVNSSMNSSSAKISGNILTLGSSSIAGSGYSYLPNGILMQWGYFASLNTTAQAVNFPIAYSTNCFSFFGSLNGADSMYINSLNSTAAFVSTSAGTHGLFWTALGH